MVRQDPPWPTGHIDRAALDRLDALDDEGNALRHVVSLFLADAPKQVAALREAVEREDAVAAAQALHNLRGSSGLVGATALEEVCLQVEQKVGRGATPLTEHVEVVQATLDRVVSELVAELARRLPGRPESP